MQILLGAPRTKRKISFVRFYVAGAFKFEEFITLRNVPYYSIYYFMYYVYILQSSKDQSFYIGYTTDLKKRLTEHNNGSSLATKYKRPYKLIFYEGFLDRIDAKHRETYLKSGWGFRSIKKLLKNFLH